MPCLQSNMFHLVSTCAPMCPPSSYINVFKVQTFMMIFLGVKMES